MGGTKRKSEEDVHASIAKSEEAGVEVGAGEARRASSSGKTPSNVADITAKREEKKRSPTKRRKSKQSTDFFNELPSLMGLETLPTISRQNSFSIYNNGGEITRVLSNNNLFAAEDVVRRSSSSTICVERRRRRRKHRVQR